MLLCVLTTATAAAFAGGALRLDGAVVGNGGTSHASGAGHELAGSIAQPLAGASGAGALRLDAGFWAPAARALSATLFRDGFED